MSNNSAEILEPIEASPDLSALPGALSGDEVDDLVLRAKIDPGAPFETTVLVRMVATKKIYLPTFMRLRARLKGAGVGVTELDKALSKYEVTSEGGPNGLGGDGPGIQGRPISFPDLVPWPDEVDGPTLLTEIIAHIERHVMLGAEAAIGIALWIMHAYCFVDFTISPRLVITSPEKRCGKTTLLRIIQAMVPRPLAAANITAAAMFRTIEKYRPTLLIDEADTFLADNEELRGVINSGHERNGAVIRLVGDDHEPSSFSTFCPTVIAAIGSLPGTIEDRAVMIVLRRRLATESVLRFRSEDSGYPDELSRKIARWTLDNMDVFREADPGMPQELHDRACDNWRPLLAIADHIGNGWSQQARSAAIVLSVQGGEPDDQSRGVMLLADIFRVFDDPTASFGKNRDRISSSDLASALHALTDRPWATWMRGKPITSAAIARALKPFGVVPTTIKLVSGKQPNGYRRSQFDDAFARYLPQHVVLGSQSSPSSPHTANSDEIEQSACSPPELAGELSGAAGALEEHRSGDDGEHPMLDSAHGGEEEDGQDELLADLLNQITLGALVRRSASSPAG